MVTTAELIFWIVALIVAIAFVGGCLYWERKVDDPFAHRADDDFNKDIWED